MTRKIVSFQHFRAFGSGSIVVAKIATAHYKAGEIGIVLADFVSRGHTEYIILFERGGIDTMPHAVLVQHAAVIGNRKCLAVRADHHTSIKAIKDGFVGGNFRAAFDEARSIIDADAIRWLTAPQNDAAPIMLISHLSGQ